MNLGSYNPQPSQPEGASLFADYLERLGLCVAQIFLPQSRGPPTIHC